MTKTVDVDLTKIDHEIDELRGAVLNDELRELVEEIRKDARSDTFKDDAQGMLTCAERIEGLIDDE